MAAPFGRRAHTPDGLSLLALIYCLVLAGSEARPPDKWNTTHPFKVRWPQTEH